MKDQAVNPTALKILNNIDVMVQLNDFHDLHSSSSRDKLSVDWSPSSPTSCHDSVDDLNDADSDASPVSVDSNVVINTFNMRQHPADSDSDEDCCSLDLQDLHQQDNEIDSWTLLSPKSISNDGKRAITQIPLKNRALDDDKEDNGIRLLSYPPKKRQKLTSSMFSNSNQPFSALNSVNGTTGSIDAKNVRRNFAISFKETVDVLSIPMWYDYSPDTRAQLWSSINEINENAARNTIEFASEGWDWRNVTLDNDMFHCPTTGQFIHPVHSYNQSLQPTETTINNILSSSD